MEGPSNKNVFNNFNTLFLKKMKEMQNDPQMQHFFPKGKLESQDVQKQLDEEVCVEIEPKHLNITVIYDSDKPKTQYNTPTLMHLRTLHLFLTVFSLFYVFIGYRSLIEAFIYIVSTLVLLVMSKQHYNSICALENHYVFYGINILATIANILCFLFIDITFKITGMLLIQVYAPVFIGILIYLIYEFLSKNWKTIDKYRFSFETNEQQYLLIIFSYIIFIILFNIAAIYEMNEYTRELIYIATYNIVLFCYCILFTYMWRFKLLEKHFMLSVLLILTFMATTSYYFFGFLGLNYIYDNNLKWVFWQ